MVRGLGDQNALPTNVVKWLHLGQKAVVKILRYNCIEQPIVYATFAQSKIVVQEHYI